MPQSDNDDDDVKNYENNKEIKIPLKVRKKGIGIERHLLVKTLTIIIMIIIITIILPSSFFLIDGDKAFSGLTP